MGYHERLNSWQYDEIPIQGKRERDTHAQYHEVQTHFKNQKLALLPLTNEFEKPEQLYRHKR